MFLVYLAKFDRPSPFRRLDKGYYYIPSQNKFLIESANSKIDKPSPIKRIYTPTPTRKIPTFQANDSNCDPCIFLSQLSNKGIGKYNFESPFMFADDNNVTSLHWFDLKLCSPKMMSPVSLTGNNDFLKYHLQLSGSLLIQESKDNFIMNASPRCFQKSANKVRIYFYVIVTLEHEIYC